MFIIIPYSKILEGTAHYALLIEERESQGFGRNGWAIQDARHVFLFETFGYFSSVSNQSLFRPSKCLNHHNQRLCKKNLAGVNIVAPNIQSLFVQFFSVKFAHYFFVYQFKEMKDNSKF